MSATKNEILKDLNYCKESLDRIIKNTENTMMGIIIIIIQSFRQILSSFGENLMKSIKNLHGNMAERSEADEGCD